MYDSWQNVLFKLKFDGTNDCSTHITGIYNSIYSTLWQLCTAPVLFFVCCKCFFPAEAVGFEHFQRSRREAYKCNHDRMIYQTYLHFISFSPRFWSLCSSNIGGTGLRSRGWLYLSISPILGHHYNFAVVEQGVLVTVTYFFLHSSEHHFAEFCKIFPLILPAEWIVNNVLGWALQKKEALTSFCSQMVSWPCGLFRIILCIWIFWLLFVNMTFLFLWHRFGKWCPTFKSVHSHVVCSVTAFSYETSEAAHNIEEIVVHEACVLSVLSFTIYPFMAQSLLWQATAGTSVMWWSGPAHSTGVKKDHQPR